MTPAPASRPHVLLIDDHVENLRLLVELLRQERFRLSVAFDGTQGCQRAQALRPDLILLDVRMPRLDGFGTCRLLKSDPATRHIPILFLTSASDLDDRLEGLRIGGVDYILKPFAAEEVLARIRVHLQTLGYTFPNAFLPAAVVSDTKATPAPADIAPIDPEQILVEAAQRLLDDHLQSPPSLAALAQALGTYDKRLSQAFRNKLGTTVFAFVRQRRLEWAQTLLRTSHLPIAAIADELGFSSSANFATAFREQTGQTPKAFREQAKPAESATSLARR
ncbi:MAG: response regulator [Pigmentiphaga sp.]|nr:response regulator [Pigmentiphaga sp.]